MRRITTLALSAIALVGAGCVVPSLFSGNPSYPPVETVRSKPDAHVILIAVDGLRPDAITADRTPTLHRLIGQGAYTNRAQNIVPPRTLPNHAAMVTGLDASGHGVTNNGYQGSRRISVPTIFDRAQAAGLSTAIYYGKDKFLLFERPGSLNWAERRDGGDIAADFARDFAKVKWNLSMVCFPDADAAGHGYGWMSPQYLKAVQNIDGYVALLLASVEASGLGDKVNILLTADHGGQDYSHSDDLPINRTIPFLIVGPNVKPGTALGADGRRVSITDFAPTAARLLGIELNRTTAGRYLGEAFETKMAGAPAIKPTSSAPSAVPAVMPMHAER